MQQVNAITTDNAFSLSLESIQHVIIYFFVKLCPVHLPEQIIFCLGQNQICPIQNEFVKDKISFVQDKNFVHSLKIIFAFGKLVSCHGQNFCLGQKIFCPGQNYFVEDKSDFVPDKNLFVRADGQGNRSQS